MFVSRFRSDIGDRSPFGDFWFSPVGSRTSAGARVSADSAMQLAAVYACVRVLAESFAILPFQLYRPKVGGGRVRVTDHWLVRLFGKRPNRWQTPFEWREMMQGHLALRGNGYNEIFEDGAGGIAELVPLHPDRVKVEMLDTGDYRYRYTEASGQSRVIRRDKMWHLRGLSSDGIVGLSPIELARESLGEGLAMQGYSSNFYANDAKPGGGWIEFPGKFADAAAKMAFRQSWAQLQGGRNRGATAVLDQGMKFHELAVNNKDAQFLEGRNFKTSEIARIFRVPPHKIGDLSKATFSNIEQQSIEFWQDTMLPWSERWESSVESTLLGEDTDLEVEFDMSRMMRGDAKSRAERISLLTNGGIMLVNEARAEEGLDPIEGGYELRMPANMVNVEDADPNGEAGPGEDKPDAPPADPDEEGADAKRLDALLVANAGRMAKRVHAGQPPSSEVLAEALAIPLADAEDWLSLYGNNGARNPEGTLAAALTGLARRGGYKGY